MLKTGRFNLSQCLFNLICQPGSCGENYPKGSSCCVEPEPCTYKHSRTDSCCSPMNQCHINQGHCSSHQDCYGSLQCGKNNCDWSSDNNCCTTPYNPGGNFFHLSNKKIKNKDIKIISWLQTLI